MLSGDLEWIFPNCYHGPADSAKQIWSAWPVSEARSTSIDLHSPAGSCSYFGGTSRFQLTSLSKSHTVRLLKSIWVPVCQTDCLVRQRTPIWCICDSCFCCDWWPLKMLAAYQQPTSYQKLRDGWLDHERIGGIHCGLLVKQLQTASQQCIMGYKECSTCKKMPHPLLHSFS